MKTVSRDEMWCAEIVVVEQVGISGAGAKTGESGRSQVQSTSPHLVENESVLVQLLRASRISFLLICSPVHLKPMWSALTIAYIFRVTV